MSDNYLGRLAEETFGDDFGCRQVVDTRGLIVL